MDNLSVINLSMTAESTKTFLKCTDYPLYFLVNAAIFGLIYLTLSKRFENNRIIKHLKNKWNIEIIGLCLNLFYLISILFNSS
jgi:hypothetical protein